MLFDNQNQFEWALFAKVEPPKIKWNRMDYKGERFYFSHIPEFVTGVGITTVIDKVSGESQFLREWKDNTPNWREYLAKSASYGTLNHIGLNEIAQNGFVSKDWVKIAKDVFNKEDQFKRDMLSIIKFFNDVNFEPIMCEGIVGQEYSIGFGKVAYIVTATDLVGWMDVEEKIDVNVGEFTKGVNKGKPKFEKEIIKTRVLAIVDLKSSFEEKESKTYYDSHKLQLLFGKRCLEREYGWKDIRCFNLTPKKWRTEPSYFLKEQKSLVNHLGVSDLEILDMSINLAIAKGELIPSGGITEIEELNMQTKPIYLNYESMVKKYKT